MSEHKPLEVIKECSTLFPTGVAGRDKEACTAESVLLSSKVGELGADILSVVRSRTASSCLRSREKRRHVKHGLLIWLEKWLTDDSTSRLILQPLHRHQQRLLLV